MICFFGTCCSVGSSRALAETFVGSADSFDGRQFGDSLGDPESRGVVPYFFKNNSKSLRERAPVVSSTLSTRGELFSRPAKSCSRIPFFLASAVNVVVVSFEETPLEKKVSK